MGDPQGQRYQPGPAAGRAGLVTILALPGPGDRGAAFFTVGLPGGVQACVLAVVEHTSRRIRILGVILHPTGQWTAQQARNLVMDLGEQAAQVKFMIRDRGSNVTAAFDAVLVGAGIRAVLCNIRTPRMNAIAERWTGDAGASSWTAPWSGTRPHLRRSCATTRPITISTGRTAHCTQPLKPLPEPVDLERYRVRRRTRAGGTINEYRLAA